MNNWIIEPRDPLIVRDGKPFSATPGARASSLPFPYPSTTTGTARTRAGSNAEGVFEADPQEIIKLGVNGPLLVELDENDEISDWLVPAPADALLQLNEDGEVIRQRLVPLALNGAQTDLDDGYHIVGMVEPNPLKPYGKAPRFWRWGEFEQWLLQPPDESHKGGKILNVELGHNGPTPETRTHVKIDPRSQTAEESFLFQTRGMEFTQVKEPGKPFREVRRLGLAVAAAVTPDEKIEPGVSSLGGERRIVFWRNSNKPLIPDCPADLPKKLAAASGHCRVVLLTPAIFKDGWLPNKEPDAHSPRALLAIRHGIKPVLKAAALPRYQVISGWDYENKCPKKTRRMMPAGSVLFLHLQEAEPGTPGDIDAWVNDVWRSCVSDAPQDCLDGFGLATLGVWSGVPQPMEVK